jgi:Na+-translocating ferredoxin:NAD+ oxidoreductase RnfD subunit
MAKTIITTDAPVSNVMDIMIGKFCGAMGTGFTVIMLIAAVFLMIRKTIPAITFFTQLAAFFAYFYIHSGYSITYTAGALSGEMILFGMIFLAYGGFKPSSRMSEFIYGLLTAVLTIIFRKYTGAEYSVVYASVVSAPMVTELNRNSLSLAGISSYMNKGRLHSIVGNLGKALNNVRETLTLINGSDGIEQNKRNGIGESDKQ